MFANWRRNQSIATRLFLSAAAWSTILLLIAGIFLVTLYRRNTEKAFDDRLSVYLRALVADMAVGNDEQRDEAGQLGDPQFDLAQSGWYWQITRIDGNDPLVKQSPSLSGASLPRSTSLSSPGSGGVRSSFIRGPDARRLRMFERVIDIGAAGTFLIQVAGTTEDVEDQIWRFKFALVMTFTLLAIALVGTTALQVRYGLKPLRELQGEVAAIRHGDSERIEGDFTHDLSPLADELNLLISSNREVVERARTQVGNLAHALKTPLSVITNEADSDPTPLAGKVREQATIMRDQVTYYLDRARAAARSTVVGSVVLLDEPIDALMRTFEKIYFDRHIDFDVDCQEGLRFRGEKQDLEEMVGNLIDNAGKWARSQVQIRVAQLPALSGETEFGPIEITIADDGPGLPAGQRADALTRGRRLDETKPGSGLGLSIVNDLASVYGGHLTLEDSPLGGLLARLRLPSA